MIEISQSQLGVLSENMLSREDLLKDTKAELQKDKQLNLVNSSTEEEMATPEENQSGKIVERNPQSQYSVDLANKLNTKKRKSGILIQEELKTESRGLQIDEMNTARVFDQNEDNNPFQVSPQEDLVSFTDQKTFDVLIKKKKEKTPKEIVREIQNETAEQIFQYPEIKFQPVKSS